MVAKIFFSRIFLGSISAALSLTLPKMNFKECLEKDDMIASLIKISLENCIHECVMRLECLSLNYRRGFLMCELFYNSTGVFVTNIGQTGPCVHMLRSDIRQPQYPTNCACTGQQTCLPESGSCVAMECPALNISNVVIQGNMNNIGSRVKVTCNNVSHNIQCQSNGTWDNLPTCTSRSLGCYARATEDWNRMHHMTIETCVSYCDQYKYAVLKYWSCNCLDILDGYTASTDDKCTHVCPGNHAQICGGYYDEGVYYASVYKVK